ncbi:DUF6268 family outer membrane beta-barrel protein [Chryseolinea lacunae]|uniref:DUF6268 domain-containing protein n=1 Tax=Chryseolinea lacunae TaxID=2801331 RepID=A0ABS1L4N7_9BACT|nr:DUF6268 family outer membrane beta-barrel protein [Chryseolinea lacunae]MBL0745882.1 hypothetical protein [Chryseolinea lacunae]
MLILSCLSSHAMAQFDKEVFHVKYSISPVMLNGERDALHAVDFNVKFPLKMKGRSMFGGGIGYESLWTNRGPLIGDLSVQGISAQFLFNRNFDNGHALLGFASAGVYSDFKDVSNEDFRYSVGMRYKTKLHEKFTMWYGIAFSKQFFGVLVAPFIDFHWRITPRLRMTGPLPLNTQLRYALRPKVGLTFFLKPDNATYRLSRKDYESRYFQKKQWNAGCGVEYQLTRHWLVTLRGGYSLKRKFETYEASQTGVLSILTFDLQGGKRIPYNQYQENAFLAEAMIAWVLSKD